MFTSRAPENPSIDASLWCPDAAEQAKALEQLAGDAGADVELTSRQGDRRFRSVREQAWSNADVAEYFAMASTAMKACRGATWTAPDGEKIAYQPLEGPGMGDESTSALVVTVTSGPEGDVTWRTRETVARFGTTLLVLQDLDVQPGEAPPPLSDGQWQETVEAATARIAQLGQS